MECLFEKRVLDDFRGIAALGWSSFLLLLLAIRRVGRLNYFVAADHRLYSKKKLLGKEKCIRSSQWPPRTIFGVSER